MFFWHMQTHLRDQHSWMHLLQSLSQELEVSDIGLFECFSYCFEKSVDLSTICCQQVKLYNTRCRKGTACPPVDPPLLKHKTALYFLTGMFLKIIQFTRCDRLHKTLTIFYHVAMVFLETNLNNQSNSGFLTLRWVLLQPSLIPLLQIGR